MCKVLQNVFYFGMSHYSPPPPTTDTLTYQRLRVVVKRAFANTVEVILSNFDIAGVFYCNP